jgi:hypothetical protein
VWVKGGQDLGYKRLGRCVYRLVVVFRYMYWLFVHGDIVYPLQLELCWPWWALGGSCSVGCCQVAGHITTVCCCGRVVILGCTWWRPQVCRGRGGSLIFTSCWSVRWACGLNGIIRVELCGSSDSAYVSDYSSCWIKVFIHCYNCYIYVTTDQVLIFE